MNQTIATCLIQYVAPICKKRKVEFNELDTDKTQLMFAGYCLGIWDKNEIKAKTNELCDKAIAQRAH